MTKLILASGSSGRKSLLEALNLKFDVLESGIDEEKIQDTDPVKLAIKRATAKAESVANELTNSFLVIGADTVGFMDKWVFGKPKSRKEAEEMLQKLSGKTHKYVSAHCVIKISEHSEDSEIQDIRKPEKSENRKNINLIRYSDILNFPTSRFSEFSEFSEKLVGYDISSVTFRKLTNTDIKTYLDHVEYSKLAGGFKLANSPQDFVTRVEGSISNIIGLSLEKIIPVLRENFLL